MGTDMQVRVITDATPTLGATGDGVRGGDDVGGGFGLRPDGGAFRLVSLSADGLRDQVCNLLEVVQYVFNQSISKSTLALDEVELSVEINSEGQISILGTGGRAGGRGAIKLLFKRGGNPVAKVAATARSG